MSNKNIASSREAASLARQKLQELKARRDELETSLNTAFNMAQYRQLQLVNNSIECAKNRLDGKKEPRCEFELKIERNDTPTIYHR